MEGHAEGTLWTRPVSGTCGQKWYWLEFSHTTTLDCKGDWVLWAKHLRGEGNGYGEHGHLWPRAAMVRACEGAAEGEPGVYGSREKPSTPSPARLLSSFEV